MPRRALGNRGRVRFVKTHRRAIGRAISSLPRQAIIHTDSRGNTYHLTELPGWELERDSKGYMVVRRTPRGVQDEHLSLVRDVRTGRVYPTLFIEGRGFVTDPIKLKEILWRRKTR